MDSDSLDTSNLDDWLLRIISQTSHFFPAQWEDGRPPGRQMNDSSGQAAAATGGDESRITAEFYRIAFQDPEFRAAFRRRVAGAVYLELGITPKQDLT